jgi:hypothetical protein
MKLILAIIIVAFGTLGPAGAQDQPDASADPCPIQSGWSAPGRIQLAAVPSGLRVSWMLPPGAPTEVTGFQIVRAPDLGGPWAEVGLAERSVTEFIDTAAIPGAIYYYQVRAFHRGVCTPFSATVFGQR